MVKMQFSQAAPVYQHRLTAAWLMFKNLELLYRLSYQGVRIFVGKLRNFSTSFMFKSKSDSGRNGSKTGNLS
jgi:hypothetical protein